ncbi:hypothetical protein DITRI_Ditri20bG0052900 [Diplodiscus trichospermus]
MDLQDVLALDVEIGRLENEREMKRLMEESLMADQDALWEKVRELSMLKRVKQRMVAKEAAKKKLFDDFMVFIGAIENNDLENALKFDEKAMKNNILNLMNSDSAENGEFSSGYGDRNALGIDLGLEEKARRDATEAPVISIANFGGDNGVLAGGHGGINNSAESANNLGEEGLRTPAEGTNSDGGEGSFAGGYDGSNRRN